ncbi:MAG: sel1 repeat family protein, partial [Desulfobacterium sp.]|nr:sel1 repeat family protein [Desulfobacterium sp.]
MYRQLRLCFLVFLGILLFFHGNALSMDKKQIGQLKTAAMQGEPTAQNELGLIYFNGDGIPVNYLKAMKWFKKAAEQNDAKAQNNLGVMYLNGDGVPQNYQEAMKWFKKAA